MGLRLAEAVNGTRQEQASECGHDHIGHPVRETQDSSREHKLTSTCYHGLHQLPDPSHAEESECCEHQPCERSLPRVVDDCAHDCQARSFRQNSAGNITPQRSQHVGCRQCCPAVKALHQFHCSGNTEHEDGGDDG